MDRIIRNVAFPVVLLIGFIIILMRDPRIWLLEPWTLLLILFFITEAVRAIMEWKYAEHRNAYIATTSQLVLVSILILIFKTNFLNWFG